MTAAYEGALHYLGLKDRSDPLTEVIAKKIIEVSRSGERDPALISARAVSELRIAAHPKAPTVSE